MLFDEIRVPTDFSTVSDGDLRALENQARQAAAPLIPRAQGDGDPLTEDEVAGLQKLSSVVASVRDERSRRIGEASAAAANAHKTKEALEVFATAAPEDDVDEEADEEVEPEVPAAKPEAKKPPRVSQVASAGTGRTPKVKTEDDEDPQAKFRSKMVSAPNLPNTPAGKTFSNMREVADAIEAQFSLYPRGSQVQGGQYMKNPVMYLQRNFAPELRIGERSSEEDITAVFDRAADQSRLEGNSIVAAAGWCAPSQIDYALFELEGTAGLLDMPEVQISRGGIQFTTGPDFSTIFASSGFWHQTEAQVQAATSKPCMVIPCPSFTEKRLDVEGVCITGAFLQDRGYPEMVARFARGAMKAHVRKLNIFKINQVIAGSTLFDYTNVANLAVTTTEYKDLTVLNRLLTILGIQATDYRYKYRMDPDATLEVILPAWVLESIRADVQRRMSCSVDESLTVTMDQVNRWFGDRNLRVQWIYDWLDTYNATNTSTVGQSAGVYTLPTTVEAVLYAPGTWVAGVSDVVRLDTVYDSTNLALNQYTQLFTEEGILVAKRGFESRRIKTTIDPSGALAATVDMRTG